jgi:hypothetical protein
VSTRQLEFMLSQGDKKTCNSIKDDHHGHPSSVPGHDNSEVQIKGNYKNEKDVIDPTQAQGNDWIADGGENSLFGVQQKTDEADEGKESVCLG